MWGTLRPAAGWIRTTRPGTIPRQSVGPSSEESKITWQPTQMPNIGRPARCTSRRAASSPRLRNTAMAASAPPTPGKITRSAVRTRSGSALVTAAAPRCATASSTLRRLPAS